MLYSGFETFKADKEAGRDEQATLVSIGGIVLVLLMLVEQLGELFHRVAEVFGL